MSSRPAEESAPEGAWPAALDRSAAGEEAEETPSIADGVERRVARESIGLDRLGGWITLAVLSLGGGVFVAIYLATGAWDPLWAGILGSAWLLLTLPGLWFAHVWPAVNWRHLSFRADERGIEIRRGILWRRVITVPRSRVQHTDVSQGPLQRRFDLATLIIHTAGTDHATVELPGLSHATALRLRDHLISGGLDDAV
ncbi:MAG: PH domain-containing protein [Planctomycetota bacterium]